MVAVLALDVPAGPGILAEQLIGQVPLLHQAADAPVDEIASLAVTLTDLADAGQAVLVPYPVARQASARRLVMLLRRMLPDLALAPVPLRLPPLACAMLIDAARAVTVHGRLEAGPAAAALDALAERLTVVAWTRSAAALPRETGLVPTRQQVFWSPLARRGFELRVQPPAPGYRAWDDRSALLPEVRRLRADSAADALAGYLTQSPIAAVRGAENDLAWLRDTAEACGLRPAFSLPRPESTASWFGTPRAAELVLLSGDLPTLSRDLDISTRTCSWCSTPTPAGHRSCLFCDHQERISAVAAAR